MKGKVIALSSTHGTGKTTSAYKLAYNLKKEGVNVVVLNELARECPLPINRKGTLETHYWLFANQIVKELELCNSYDYVIADRSIIDTAAYASVVLPEENFGKLVSDMAHEHIKNNYVTSFILDKDMFNYNVFDGVRDTNTLFRDTVYYELLKLYQFNNIAYTIVHSFEELYTNIKKYLIK